MKVDDIARLFDRDPEAEHEEQFAAEVRRAIGRERRRLKVLASLSICGFVGVAVLLLLHLPTSVLQPVQIAQAFLSSTVGMIASVVVASCVALSVRYVDS